MANIGIFGGGYIGTVSAACLADMGHNVIVVDKDEIKVQLLNEGLAPIIEPGIDDLIAKGNACGLICSTKNAAECLMQTSISFVCVGTPTTTVGSVNLNYVMGVIETIAEHLRQIPSYHLIAIRSSVLPGTGQRAIKLIEQISGRQHGRDFSICVNPEFLREGSAIQDFMNPSYSLIGAEDARGAKVLSAIYEHLPAEIIVTPIKEAEIIKYLNNSFHALKVGFANEVGAICKQLKIDSHNAMDIFCRDKKLNISTTYLKPGFAFGGSCLPKDLKAFCYTAKSLDVDTPILNSVLPSNDRHINMALRMVQNTGKSNIGIIGLAFKTGTDDLRESPMVRLVETLIGKGYNVRIYDRHVDSARIHGKNREYAIEHISHLSERMVPDSQLDQLFDFADVLVVGGSFPELRETLVAATLKKAVIDLVRIQRHRLSSENYQGICW